MTNSLENIVQAAAAFGLKGERRERKMCSFFCLSFLFFVLDNYMRYVCERTSEHPYSYSSLIYSTIFSSIVFVAKDAAAAEVCILLLRSRQYRKCLMRKKG